MSDVIEPICGISYVDGPCDVRIKTTMRASSIIGAGQKCKRVTTASNPTMDHYIQKVSPTTVRHDRIPLVAIGTALQVEVEAKRELGSWIENIIMSKYTEVIEKY